jgi:hypothetical protein
MSTVFIFATWKKLFMRRRNKVYRCFTVPMTAGKKRFITTGKKEYSHLSVVSCLAIIRCAVPIASA